MDLQNVYMLHKTDASSYVNYLIKEDIPSDKEVLNRLLSRLVATNNSEGYMKVYGFYPTECEFNFPILAVIRGIQPLLTAPNIHPMDVVRYYSYMVFDTTTDNNKLSLSLAACVHLFSPYHHKHRVDKIYELAQLLKLV